MFDGGAGPEAPRRTAERSVGAALGRYVTASLRDRRGPGDDFSLAGE